LPRIVKSTKEQLPEIKKHNAKSQKAAAAWDINECVEKHIPLLASTAKKNTDPFGSALSFLF
jgi:hypothetical protein